MDMKRFSDLLNDAVKQRIFKCIKNVTDLGIIKLSSNLFELPKSNQLFVDSITTLIESNDYLQAGTLINELNLIESFEFDKIVIPMIFLNQFKILENLIKKKEMRNETMKFLDSFLNDSIKVEEHSKMYLL
jgi:hypothetical protein